MISDKDEAHPSKFFASAHSQGFPFFLLFDFFSFVHLAKTVSLPNIYKLNCL